MKPFLAFDGTDFTKNTIAHDDCFSQSEVSIPVGFLNTKEKRYLEYRLDNGTVAGALASSSEYFNT